MPAGSRLEASAGSAGKQTDPGQPSFPAIHARSLTRIYRLGALAVTGLEGVDLAVWPGELLVLKGESGSGKSTLLSLVAGLDLPTAGDLVVDGCRLNEASDAVLTDFRRRSVGIIFQSFNLLPTLTVLENVCLPALLAGQTMEGVRARAMELLAWLGLDNRLAHRPQELSGGQMQRTAIARALINAPAIVLADEPTGNLDSRNARNVMALLADMNRRFSRTVVIATHSDLADPYATRVVKLKDGQVVL